MQVWRSTVQKFVETDVAIDNDGNLVIKDTELAVKVLTMLQQGEQVMVMVAGFAGQPAFEEDDVSEDSFEPTGGSGRSIQRAQSRDIPVMKPCNS